MTGNGVDDHYGGSVAAAGDMDGDGFPDGIVGASQGGGVGPGYVEVREGRPELVADVHTLSMASGGTQVLDLHAGLANGGATYLVLGTLGATSGNRPARRHGAAVARRLLLVHDQQPEHAAAREHAGRARRPRRRRGELLAPGGLLPSLAGQTAHHAFGALDLAVPSVELVSNPVRLEFVR